VNLLAVKIPTNNCAGYCHHCLKVIFLYCALRAMHVLATGTESGLFCLSWFDDFGENKQISQTVLQEGRSGWRLA